MANDHENPVISDEHYNNNDDYTNFLPPMTPTNSSSIAPQDMPTPGGDYISPAWAWMAALLLLCFCFKPRRDASYFVRQERIRQAAERPPPFVETQDPEQRQKLMNQCLVTKTIIGSDESGNLILGHDALENASRECVATKDDNKESDTANESSNDHNCDENVSACVICLEPFRIGDVVSWSKDNTTDCQHVFHEECIAEWLQMPKHDDCPSCRHALLKNEFAADEVDCDEQSCRVQQEDQQKYLRPLAFVIINGLVSQVRRASCCTISDERLQAMACEKVSPACPLRRVVSEGHGQTRPHRGSLFRHARHDSGADDLEPALEFTNSPNLNEVPLARTVSETGLGHRLGILSAGRVTFQRVSSGLYSRLSWAHPDLKQNENDASDDEDDIVMAGDAMEWGKDDLSATGDDSVDVEMGTANEHLTNT